MPTYPAYSTPSAQPGPYTYNVLQQPFSVLPTPQEPYGVSLFQEVVLHIPPPQSHQGISPNTSQAFFASPTIPLSTLPVTPPQKRSLTDNSTQQNLLNKSSTPTGTKPLSPEVYVPEDKYLPPTLHRFPHDIFPNDESLTNHNILLGVEKTTKSIHGELKNCSLGVSCKTGNQGRDSTKDKEDSQIKDIIKALASDGFESFKSNNMPFNLNHTNLHGYTDPQDSEKLSLNDFDRRIEYNVQNVSKLKNNTNLVRDGNGEALKTIDVNIGQHPEHFETQNVHNSKRDTHSMSSVYYSPDVPATVGIKEKKNQPCRCLHKLKKCVHDASIMAEYLVKKACNAFGNL